MLTLPRWRTVLALVQKAHYRSTNVMKLHAAVDVYVALGHVKEVQHEVLKKLGSLLSHPFPKASSALRRTFMVANKT